MRLTRFVLLALLLTACKKDKDGDGYNGDLDCNDENEAINPGTAEECDGIDNDCDGDVDEGLLLTWYADGDEDTHGDPDSSTDACVQPSGYVDNSDDCNDTSALFFPGAPEDDCEDPNDYNCDGSVGYADADSDGIAACEGDCDDSSATVNPDADEICDEIDNDCDGETDDNAIDAPTWYLDHDGDAYGDSAYSFTNCDQPPSYVDNAEDCDDLDVTSYPGAEEVCDSADNNCDGTIDEDDATDALTWYGDADGDGYGDVKVTTLACTQPSGYVDNADDCDDADAERSPETAWYADSDADGYGYSPDRVDSCEQPSGYINNSDDCDDDSDAINPDATEYCNGYDDDCNGVVDENTAADVSTWYADTDGDEFGDSSDTDTACYEPSGYVADDTDCDDTDVEVNPDAAEVCNDGVDNDCDTTGDNCTLDLDGGASARMMGEASGEGGFTLGYADLNADGDQDIIIGASPQSNSSGSSNDGAAFVYYGPFSGTANLTDADVIIYGRSGEKDTMGTAVEGLEDFDGDGVADVAISASQMDNPDSNGSAGAVFVFSGASISASTSMEPEDADIIYYGSEKQHYLAAVSAGDVDGDGLSDLLLGATWAPSRDTKEGEVYLIYGGVTAGELYADEEAQAIFQGESESDKLGTTSTIAIVGDVDGDGEGDLLMGTHSKDSDNGMAYIALGPHSGTTVASDTDIILSPATGDYLGRAVSAAGDMNGDGLDDLLIGAPRDDTGASNAGAVYLIYGSSTITSLDGLDADAAYDVVIIGDTSDIQIGADISGGRDFDGDSNNDILLGSAGYGSVGEGAAFFYYGPLSGSLDLSDADATLVGTNSNDSAGDHGLIIEDIDGSGAGGLLIDVSGADATDGTSAAGGAFLIDSLGL
ncbi:MAG: hypothetical protein ACI8RZ_005461 [Myxococcota bacterium]|jgi:hypothetical protein